MSNYTKGRAFEYETMKTWKEQGYTVARSAGSHSPVDVFAWKPDRKPELIQCKQVSSHATALRLITKFKAEVPPSSSFHQVLTIKTKGNKLRMSITL